MGEAIPEYIYSIPASLSPLKCLHELFTLLPVAGSLVITLSDKVSGVV